MKCAALFLSLKNSGISILLPPDEFLGRMSSGVAGEVSGMKAAFLLPLERLRNVYSISSFSTDKIKARINVSNILSK